MPNFRILGCDPGKVNFAWAVYGDGGLEDHGVIEGADRIERLDNAAARFERVVKYVMPNACVLERFHQRPGKGAISNMELVNLLIGQCRIICRFYQIPTYLVTAAEHKKWTAQNFDVKRIDVKNKHGVNKKFDISTYKEWQELPTPHEVDAANVAKYAWEHKLKHLHNGKARKE